MSFVETIKADAKLVLDEAGEPVVYVPKSGGALKINATPFFGGRVPRAEGGGESIRTEFVLEVAKADVPVVTVGTDRVRIPGEWVRKSEATVSWRVAAIQGDATSPGVWKLKLAK